jgi:hypothetical protein
MKLPKGNTTCEELTTMSSYNISLSNHIAIKHERITKLRIPSS